MTNLRLSFVLTSLTLTAQLHSQPNTFNNTLRGKVLYQSSGNKPAVGVRIAEPDANAVFSLDNGDYQLKFQNKRNGAALTLEVGKGDGNGQKLELVNEKEVKAARLPANAEEPLDIIVCPAGQRDIAAQRYYRILRTTADRELERKKKEVENLLAQKEKDYQKISDLFALIDRMQGALDSAKIREQAFNVASINLDRASQMVKDAVKKIDEENDVEGALKILNAEALDTAYENASTVKRKADAAIQQVIEGYEFRTNLLVPQFKYGEAAECYEKIAGIYEKEGYDKEELAYYLVSVANFRRYYGEYQKALEFDGKALLLREKVLPTDHLDLALSYNNLGVTYFNLGEYKKSLDLYAKALSIQEKALPPEHPDLVRCYNNLATDYSKLGDQQKALEYILRAIQIQEKVLSINDLYLAVLYNNLAFIYGQTGNYQKQLEFNLKNLFIRKNALPAYHPDLASSYSNLALAYGNLGDYQKQLEYSLNALTIREKVLPAYHPDLASSYINLALAYGNLGDYQKQLEYNLKALTIQEKVLPTYHPDLALSYNNLAWTYSKLGNHQKSLEFNLKALVIREKVLPSSHPDLAISYNNIALIYYDLGEYEKQLEYSLKALTIMEKSLPSNHLHLAIAYTNVGSSYRIIGDYAKGIEYGQKAITIGESSNPQSSYLNIFYNNIGTTYIKARQYPEAKAALEKSEALKHEERVYRGWAMYYALQKEKKLAIGSLQKAIALGFKDLKWLETEPDLTNIRKEKRYKDLVQQLKNM